MLLRTLWSRLGAQLHAESRPGCILSSARTHPAPWSFSRICHLNSLHQQHEQKKKDVLLPALGGFKSLSIGLLTCPGRLTNCKNGQACFYSTNLVKSVLKSGLKPATVPGKRAPKGPRTKQPSRANQPSLSEDKVIHPSVYWNDFCLGWYCFICLMVCSCRIWCSASPLQQQISIIYQRFLTTW